MSKFTKIVPVQVKPSPVYPKLQVQLKLSGTLVQVACLLHPPLFSAHSSRSMYYMYTTYWTINH